MDRPLARPCHTEVLETRLDLSCSPSIKRPSVRNGARHTHRSPRPMARRHQRCVCGGFVAPAFPTAGSADGFGPLPSLAPWDNTDNNNPNSNNGNRGRTRSSRIFFLKFVVGNTRRWCVRISTEVGWGKTLRRFVSSHSREKGKTWDRTSLRVSEGLFGSPV